jgi:hypothetical protein
MDEAVVTVRLALARYDKSGSPAALDQAFAAVAAAIAALRGDRAREQASADEVRQLIARLPEYDRLVTAAVGEAERAVRAGARRLWDWFGLHSEPPAWDASERPSARLLVACACAPLAEQGAKRLQARLLRLEAKRWAALLTAELRAADETVWRRALGERYESVHRRYAPRGKWRTHQLSDLIAADQTTATALRKRLARWLAEDRDFNDLLGELEAAIVETRTPPRLA